MSIHLGLSKVEFDYDAQTEEELSVKEDDIVWLLEDDDPESVLSFSPLLPTRTLHEYDTSLDCTRSTLTRMIPTFSHNPSPPPLFPFTL